MKYISFVVLLLAGTMGSGDAGAFFYSAPLLRMYRTINGTLNDNFYTTQVSERDLSISCCGYTLPTSGPDFIGFFDQATYPNNSETRPFQRFYKGAPQTDHFYTSSASETQFVLAFGYQLERVEGRVFTSPARGTTKLYRLSYGYPNGDLKHFYSADWAEISSRLAAGGWGSTTGPTSTSGRFRNRSIALRSASTVIAGFLRASLPTSWLPMSWSTTPLVLSAIAAELPNSSSTAITTGRFVMATGATAFCQARLARTAATSRYSASPGRIRYGSNTPGTRDILRRVALSSTFHPRLARRTRSISDF